MKWVNKLPPLSDRELAIAVINLLLGAIVMGIFAVLAKGDICY